jgi:EAL domain-containing protein (putative c-di-GMP-specific phosphodiesterase class I)
MAKERGRNRIHCYAAEDLDRARRHGDLQWAPRLTTALQENRLELFGQRLQPLTPGLPERVEVLLRLRERDGTLIAPMAFIPAAERYGLIAELDRWVVKNTIEAIAGLDFTAGAPIFNINLSGDSLADDRLIDLIRGAATRHGVPPSALCFEVAETAAIRNLTQTSKLMTRLGAEGYTFALDDFGSGLSSFNYLKNLPVHAIKIDGSFIRALQPDSLDYVMVQATAQIGRLLGKRTMAESVELEETLLLLRQIGVDYAQGFHLGRPEPLRQFIAGNGTGVPRKATGC